MATVTELTIRVMAAIAGLGVPWWGWGALVVMMFLGLLVPGLATSETEEMAPGLQTR